MGYRTAQTRCFSEGPSSRCEITSHHYNLYRTTIIVPCRTHSRLPFHCLSPTQVVQSENISHIHRHVLSMLRTSRISRQLGGYSSIQHLFHVCSRRSRRRRYKDWKRPSSVCKQWEGVLKSAWTSRSATLRLFSDFRTMCY